MEIFNLNILVSVYRYGTSFVLNIFIEVGHLFQKH